MSGADVHATRSGPSMPVPEPSDEPYDRIAALEVERDAARADAAALRERVAVLEAALRNICDAYPSGTYAAIKACKALTPSADGPAGAEEA